MQMISGGIGLDSVAFTKTAVMLYGNDKFGAEFGKAPIGGGKKLCFVKARREGDHWEFDFRIDPTGLSAYTKNDDEHLWRRAFSGSFKRPSVLPMIGRTPVTMAKIAGDTITVGIPARFNPLAPRTRQPKSDVRVPDAEPELQQADTTMPTPGPTPTNGFSEMRLGQLVREINARKTELGESLSLSITNDGTLRALVEYG